MMTSSEFDDDVIMSDFLEYQSPRGWSEVVWTACRREAACECCVRLEVGCLCEATTVEMELRRAQREMIRAQIAHEEWFEVHRQPQIDAERRQFAARERASWRRWRRRQRRRRLERQQERQQHLAEHDWTVLGETGGTGADATASVGVDEASSTAVDDNERRG